MLGNLIKEIKVVPNITKVLQNAMMYGVFIIFRINRWSRKQQGVYAYQFRLLGYFTRINQLFYCRYCGGIVWSRD